VKLNAFYRHFKMAYTHYFFNVSLIIFGPCGYF